MQTGQIFQRHGAWHLRYRVGGKRICQKLANYSEKYRTIKSVRPLAEAILHPINQGNIPAAESRTQTIQQFIEAVYLPHIQLHRRPSTYRGYRNLYNAHVAPHVAGIRMFTFRTSDAQRLMNTIATKHDLAHRTLIHVKSFLSGVFTVGRRMDAFDGANPLQGVEIPKGRESEDTYAYSNDEIQTMLDVLEGTARVAVMVGAYCGLSLCELQGLQWIDISKSSLRVQRTIWHGIEGLPKTKARKGAMPLLPVVYDTLVEHQRNNPGTKWVFESPRVKPYDLATFGTKRITPALEGSGVDWHGWHALRRGFATRLHEAGVQDKIIQELMRHSSLSVTMAHYVKATPEANIEAIKKLR